ncbi:hypothetical protein LTR78_005271 [Recurvomyces mirabilis]|uniref:BRCT domain-containing protein n=1 Tax=Recurvomyces mirabilis TaxID=574656 RepID=A0AAE0WNG3_9PEZI|nr:hypothetical protein LTR78_005271 [Recurvomyces mirabilis]KAK5157821.1 hypothetical protein LTS14_003743 [Recurvomyces mirabilis]
MVSTRRTAQIEPADDMAGSTLANTLRKKPVRKAAAKKAEVDTKANPTRGRNAATMADDQVVGEPVESTTLSLQTKPTRKPAGRTKKTTTQQPAEEVESSVAPPSKTARATRTKKTELLVEELADRDDVPQSRPTRRTRATEPKARPLSPKKITQVARPRTRKTDGKRSADKPQAIRTAARGARAARARTVSDENAEVPDLLHQEESEDEIMVVSSTPVKRLSPVKTSPRKRADSEASMSSRATTPSASPVPSFDKIEDENEYAAPNHDHESDLEQEENARLVSDNSDDELCGPKTPMKRSSPGTGARHRASVRKVAQSSIEETRNPTPVVQYRALASHTKTPKTQLPYKKHTVPESTERSLTVGWAGRITVEFRNVREEEAQADKSPDATSHDALTSVSSGETDRMSEVQHEVVSEPEQEISAMPDRRLAGEADLIPEPLDDDFMQQNVYDPKETIIISDESGTDMAGQEEATNIEGPVPQDLEKDAEHVDVHIVPHSTTPETLIWDNIRQDITIPIDFDSHLMGLTLAPSVNAMDMMDENIENDFSDLSQTGDALFAANASISDDTHDDSLLSNEGLESNTQDGTINLNDFIDVAALAEQTQALNLPTQQMECAIEEDEDEATVLIIETTANAKVADTAVPHYALPTASFDARRTSMPAVSFHTPLKLGARPTTSDGASMPRMPLIFNRPWVATPTTARRSDCNESGDLTGQDHSTTPSRRWESISPASYYASIEEHAKTTAGPKRFQTPTRQIKNTSAMAKRASANTLTPRASSLRPRPAMLEHAEKSTPRVEDDSETSFAMETPVPRTPAERYPLLSQKAGQLDHAQTVAPPPRYRTPLRNSTRRPATVSKISAQATTPQMQAPHLRRQDGNEETTEALKAAASPAVSAAASTPTHGERFPKLPAHNNYNDHAKTASAPRFKTPAKSPLKRPSTVQKQVSLRKFAVANNTTMGTRTPVMTPLKPPAMTPGQVPMTPHPSAPLKAVVAMVEVYTLEGASASAPFIALLHRLGAKTTKVWNERVTHVVFKDGSPTTLQRVRLHNKGVGESGTGSTIYCVNSRWVTDCDTESKRVEESDEAYVVDVTEVPRGGQRRRKSMEPSALINLGGNIVRDRKSSIGRSSLGRTPLKFDSPAKQPEMDVTSVTTPPAEAHTSSDKENKEEPSSPATPAYLAAPDKLIQQTAPINRMRKLGTKTKEANKLRRLTYFNGTGHV